MPATQIKAYARAIEAGYRERWRAWVAKQRTTTEDTAPS
jgi:hypothetical protein